MLFLCPVLLSCHIWTNMNFLLKSTWSYLEKNHPVQDVSTVSMIYAKLRPGNLALATLAT